MNPVKKLLTSIRTACVAQRDTRLQFQAHRDAEVLIVTRSMNERLYAMSDALIGLPYPRVRVTNCPGFIGSVRYLFAQFQTNAEWIINIDEDAFVIDPARIAALIDYMRDRHYAFCGNPDGGVCKHRFHNPVAVNPFFNIYHAARIRPRLQAVNPREVRATRYSSALERFTPNALLKPGFEYAYDDFEPFYGFFFWMLQEGFEPFYLDSKELDDGLTTELYDPSGAPLLWHTWFARRYDTDPEVRARIDARFREAQQKNHPPCS